MNKKTISIIGGANNKRLEPLNAAKAFQQNHFILVDTANQNDHTKISDFVMQPPSTMQVSLNRKERRQR